MNFSCPSLLAKSHIGQPCNTLLRMCLPWTGHMICDEENICRCRPDYPVQVGDHSCRRARHINEKCASHEECRYYDSNSHCTQNPISSICECSIGFEFDESKRKCVPEGKFARKPGTGPSTAATSLLIPSAAGFIMACISLLCCCILVWNNLCRSAHINSDDPWRELHGHRSGAAHRSSSSSSSHHRNSGHRRHGAIHSSNNLQNCSITREHSVPLPSYESAFYESRYAHLSPAAGPLMDEPPPSYDEAIKQSNPQILSANVNDQSSSDQTITSTPAIQPQPLHATEVPTNDAQSQSQTETDANDTSAVSITILGTDRSKPSS